jgi:hypothetical protein
MLVTFPPGELLTKVPSEFECPSGPPFIASGTYTP